MAASSTAGPSKPSGRPRSTGRASAGRRYEAAAAAICRRRGYRIRARNVRVPGGEIDLVAEDRAGRLVLVEVRGRASPCRRPAAWLSGAKRARLLRLAQGVARRERRPVRVELVELVGRPRCWSRFFPRWGLTVRIFAVDSRRSAQE